MKKIIVHETFKENSLIWLNHLALNFGLIIEAIFWGLLPPQYTHTEEQLKNLSSGSPKDWFFWGCGLKKQPN